MAPLIEPKEEKRDWLGLLLKLAPLIGAGVGAAAGGAPGAVIGGKQGLGLYSAETDRKERKRHLGVQEAATAARLEQDRLEADRLERHRRDSQAQSAAQHGETQTRLRDNDAASERRHQERLARMPTRDAGAILNRKTGAVTPENEELTKKYGRGELEMVGAEYFPSSQIAESEGGKIREANKPKPKTLAEQALEAVVTGDKEKQEAIRQAHSLTSGGEPLYPVGPDRILTPRSEAKGKPGAAPVAQITTTNDEGEAVTKLVPRKAGQEFAAGPTAQQRNQQVSYDRAAPVIDAITDLSERINVNQGVYATIAGSVERAKAKANLNDDVAEYESLVEGATPLIARAMGHTGVLTQQDVDSVRAMFPKPPDSKSLRLRKATRLKDLFAKIRDADRTGAATPAAAGPQTNDAEKRLREKFGVKP